MPRVAHLDRGELLDGAVDGLGEAAEHPPAVGGRERGPVALRAAARAMAASVSSIDADVTVATTPRRRG